MHLSYRELRSCKEFKTWPFYSLSADAKFHILSVRTGLFGFCRKATKEPGYHVLLVNRMSGVSVKTAVRARIGTSAAPPSPLPAAPISLCLCQFKVFKCCPARSSLCRLAHTQLATSCKTQELIQKINLIPGPAAVFLKSE